ncbi:hypothetical protein [Paenibacillus alvei]|uniref:hypothetical protein n=1 Tax=Paenibacillus alvei TaxID=44250 RepID=UPI0013DB1823|nr:hypothetical protein [Paenibacillus alvei]NEZ44432.1 hypothetical protein [Paenibacillus alvei]
MIINVELFTKSYAAEMNIDETGMHMKLLPEAQADLTQYLKLVLPSYILMPEDEEDLDLDTLMKLATQWQNANPDEKLTEPTTVLPYEIPKESKDLLERMAKAQDISMTQLLIQMIDKVYTKVVVHDGEL